MRDPNNADRARWAAFAVAAMAEEAGVEDEEPAVQLSDLLVNLRHFADALGRDFNAINDGAASVYAEEVAEEAMIAASAAMCGISASQR